MTDAFVVLLLNTVWPRPHIFRDARMFPGHFGIREWKLLGLEIGSGGGGALGKEELDVRVMLSVTFS